jgi:hypothetical protein
MQPLHRIPELVSVNFGSHGAISQRPYRLTCQS